MSSAVPIAAAAAGRCHVAARPHVTRPPQRREASLSHPRGGGGARSGPVNIRGSSGVISQLVTPLPGRLRPLPGSQGNGAGGGVGAFPPGMPAPFRRRGGGQAGGAEKRVRRHAPGTTAPGVLGGPAGPAVGGGAAAAAAAWPAGTRGRCPPGGARRAAEHAQGASAVTVELGGRGPARAQPLARERRARSVGGAGLGGAGELFAAGGAGRCVGETAQSGAPVTAAGVRVRVRVGLRAAPPAALPLPCCGSGRGPSCNSRSNNG